MSKVCRKNKLRRLYYVRRALLLFVLYLALGTMNIIAMQVKGRNILSSEDLRFSLYGKSEKKVLNRRKLLHFRYNYKASHNRMKRSTPKDCSLTVKTTEYLIFECKPTLQDQKGMNNTSQDIPNSGTLLYNVFIQVSAPLDTVEIRLWYQGFYGVEAKAFKSYNKLQVLNLQNNRLSYLSTKAFTGLAKLVDLNLSHNKLQTLPKNVFDALVSLKRLNLAYNELEVIREGVFCGLSNVIDLRINDNLLVDIEENAFSSLTTYRPLIINIEQNSLEFPRPGWLKIGHNASCRVTNGTQLNAGFREMRKRVLEGEKNPWNCKCVQNDNTIIFVQTLRSLLHQYVTWFITMPCMQPEHSLQFVNVGGHRSITGKLIEKECCKITHEEILASGASDLIDKMCDDFANRNHHTFMLSESNVTIIGIVIVMLIPILLTLSPDCRQRGGAVQPTGTVVSGGRFGTTINTNNNNGSDQDNKQIVATSSDNKFTVTSV